MQRETIGMNRGKVSTTIPLIVPGHATRVSTARKMTCSGATGSCRPPGVVSLEQAIRADPSARQRADLNPVSARRTRSGRTAISTRMSSTGKQNHAGGKRASLALKRKSTSNTGSINNASSALNVFALHGNSAKSLPGKPGAILAGHITHLMTSARVTRAHHHHAALPGERAKITP